MCLELTPSRHLALPTTVALPLQFTLSRNISRDAILGGKYSNIRIQQLAGNMNPTTPWMTAAQAVAADNATKNTGPL